MTEHLTLEDRPALVADLEAGSIRDLGLLDSAAHGPTATLYGVELDAPDDDAYDLVIGVASGSIAYEESAALFATWRGPATGR